MRITEPKIHLIASSQIHWAGIEDYLESIGGLSWYNRISQEIISDAEILVEFAGRACYRSWEPGLNANVTKVREDSAEYIRNILKSKHGSVLEHAQVTFMFQDVSRVFTHELVRHRVGTAISQESLRYVRLTDIGLRIPPVLEGASKEPIVTLVEALEEFQRTSAEYYDLDNPAVPFHVKKEVTSALRRLAPIGLSTCIVWSANFRTIRHVLSARTDVGAEEEMRLVFGQVAEIMKERYPLVFGDFVCDDKGQYVTENWKV